MSNAHKYTTDGRKVVVIGSLNSQEKIVQEVFIVDGSEVPSGEHFVVKSLHDAPAVSWKERSIKEIDSAYEAAEKRNREQSNLLYQKRKELAAHLDYTGKALKGISPNTFDLLRKFLTGGVKWVVTKGYTPKVVEWVHGMYEERLRLISLFGRDDGSLTFRISQYCDNSESGSGQEFEPFDNYEDARARWVEIVGDKVNDETLKLAAEYGVELPANAVAEWRAKRVESYRTEIKRLREAIAVKEEQIASMTP